MNLKTKKIIAREFLYFTTVIILSALYFSLTFVYNNYYTHKMENLEVQKIKLLKINSTLTNNIKNKLKKREWLFFKINEKFNLTESKYNTPIELWSRLEELEYSDSLEYKYLHGANIKKSFDYAGFKNFNTFKSFLIKNRFNNKEKKVFETISTNNDSIDGIDKKLNNLTSKKLSDNNQIDDTIIFLLCIMAIIFPIRYFVYSIKWSIKIIKTN